MLDPKLYSKSLPIGNLFIGKPFVSGSPSLGNKSVLYKMHCMYYMSVRCIYRYIIILCYYTILWYYTHMLYIYIYHTLYIVQYYRIYIIFDIWYTMCYIWYSLLLYLYYLYIWITCYSLYYMTRPESPPCVKAPCKDYYLDWPDHGPTKAEFWSYEIWDLMGFNMHILCIYIYVYIYIHTYVIYIYIYIYVYTLYTQLI